VTLVREREEQHAPAAPAAAGGGHCLDGFRVASVVASSLGPSYRIRFEQYKARRF
jgi:hypothetical protein